MSIEEATCGYIMSLQNQVTGLRGENARLRRALCEYQLKYWTIQYKLSLFSIEGDA